MNPGSGKHISIFRLNIIYAVIAIAVIAFVLRLFTLQIIEGEAFQLQADENRLVTITIPAPRGVIYDRNDFQLVRNIPAFNIMITPALLPDSQAEIEAIYQRLSEITGVPVDQEGPPAALCIPGRGILQFVEEGATNRPYEAWPIACDVEEEIGRILREEQADLPGVSVETVPVRDYTTGDLTSNFIGYMGPIPPILEEFYEELGFEADRDKVGYAGVEVGYQGMFQGILAGLNGIKQIERDVAGQEVREVGSFTQPVPGNSVKLSIDTRLQAVAQTALESRIEFINRYSGEERAPLGAVIAMNPQTGEILAMVSLPTYENNRFARVIPVDYYEQLIANERGNPLSNHAIAGEFPPGSSFKMVTAVGALNEGVITPERTLDDPGKITIADRYFPNDPGKAKDFVCWKEDGHGNVDFERGIAESCNVYFYKIGGGYPGEIEQGLGVDGVNVYAPALGYGAQLGIDLPGEENGLIPSRTWKRIALGENWSTGDTYNTVVGQGFVSATPLQVLTSIATLANGGKVMWPHMVKEILDGEGNTIESIEPCVLWDLTDGEITPLEDIGANCPTMPDELRQLVISSRADIGSPDVNVDPEVILRAQAGMHRVTQGEGTAAGYADLDTISSAGKTGTGEFCDEYVFNQGLCKPGEWPTHSWYTAYAPAENPEIVVVAFVYNGGEGAVTSGPIVKQVLEAYFELKEVDIARSE